MLVIEREIVILLATLGVIASASAILLIRRMAQRHARASAALRRGEERYAALFKHAPFHDAAD
jgi:hypothetical protein